VRFISNHNSGRMGVAIAEAAWRRGARVTLIAGPLSIPLPVGPRHVAVQRTEDLLNAVASVLPDADELDIAAAPSDLRAARASGRKLKREGKEMTLELVANSDILRETIDRRRPGSVMVGFALETDDVLANARAKLASKSLDVLVVNDAREAGAGFGVATNRVTILDREGTEEVLPLLDKSAVADEI